jgi:hypothetical protein
MGNSFVYRSYDASDGPPVPARSEKGQRKNEKGRRKKEERRRENANAERKGKLWDSGGPA